MSTTRVDEGRSATPTQAEADALRWYHTIELPPGVVTRGEYDLRRVVGRLPWPASLAGLRCLDVGSRDGFYAFEMERRGAAEVISIDIEDAGLVDVPGTRRDEAAIQAELAAGNAAFEFARRALRSDVERRFTSIYDLEDSGLGGFDLVNVGTLLLHLRDPVRALRNLRAVTTGSVVLNEPTRLGLDLYRRRPLAEAVMQGEPFWWLCNPAGLRRIAEAAGLEVVRTGRPYLVPNGPGWERETLLRCFRAPLRDVPARLVLMRGAPHVWILARPAPAP